MKMKGCGIFLKARFGEKRKDFKNRGELIEEHREQVLNSTQMLFRTESINQ